MAKVNDRTLNQIRAEAELIAQPLGLGICSVRYLREDGLWYLRVALTKQDQNSVALSDCEKVHRPLSKRLDQLDLIPGTYYLEVTSPGKDLESDSPVNPDSASKLETLDTQLMFPGEGGTE